MCPNSGLLWKACFAFCKTILCYFPIDKKLIKFLYFTVKGNFPLYKLQSLVDFIKNSPYKNGIAKIKCQFGHILNQTPL